jgi:glyoxylase-like metal-dependent hydrolase (beta-lactamase superfamily II)
VDRVAHPKLEPVGADHEVDDGDELPIAGGLRVIYTPGHTAGHVSYLWSQHGGVLFAGDAAGHVFGRLAPPVGAIGGSFTEDAAQAKESFRNLAALEFDIACFGHGGVIKGKAHTAFRRKVERMAR